jgi:hypothetical protein
MTREKNYKPTLRDINIAIDALDANNTDPFIILEPSETIENTNFIQVLYYSEFNNDKNHYLLETQIGGKEDFKQYKYITSNKTEVKNIFGDYFLSQKAPKFDLWENITDEVKNEKRRSNIFFIYELAKDYYRNGKEIFNCYGYNHGNTVNRVPLLQSIAEAIVLLKDVVNSPNKQSDIYFTENRKRIIIDIKIPSNWKMIGIHRIKGLLSKGKIYISCYDNENNHIISDISPLPYLERLLACFMLIFAEKILSDEQYLFMVMDYFLMHSKDKFMDIYLAFMNNPKSLSYYVIYEDDNSLDMSNYLTFSSLYENFKINKL